MKPQEEECESVYKVLLVGEVGVGKTSIMRRVCLNSFSRHYGATIGVDFMQKKVKWSDKLNVFLQLWDIAGQERCGAMTRVFYKEASAAFVVFDVTQKCSLDIALQWKEDIDKLVFLQTPRGSIGIPVILLANKFDLYKEEESQSIESENHLSQEEMSCDDSAFVQKNRLPSSPWKRKLDNICKEHNFVGWFPTSAKDNLNLDKACKQIIHEIMQNEKHFPRESVEERRALLLMSMGLSRSPSTLSVSLNATTGSSGYRSKESNVTLVSERKQKKDACEC